MKTRSAKNKGIRLQKEIAIRISKLLDIPWGKDELIRSREAGNPGTDVVLIGEAKNRFNWNIEAKNQEKWSIHEYIKQAKANSDGKNWLLFVGRNKRKDENTIVIMDIDAFFDMQEDLLFYKKQSEDIQKELLKE